MKCNGDDPLSCLFKLTDEEVDALVQDAATGLSQRIRKAVHDGRAATEATHAAQGGNAGSKFSAELRGGDLDLYYGGVTGIVGEPRDDITKGVELEHMRMPDSQDGFTTSNYGITNDHSKGGV